MGAHSRQYIYLGLSAHWCQESAISVELLRLDRGTHRLITEEVLRVPCDHSPSSSELQEALLQASCLLTGVAYQPVVPGL